MTKKMTMLIMMLLTLASCSSKAATEAAQIVTDTAADVHDDISADDDSREADDDAVTDADDDASTEHKVYAVEDLVTYYNDIAAEEEQIAYDQEHQYWIYTSAVHAEDNDKEAMQRTVHHYLDYVSLYRIAEDGYMFRYKEHYDEDENSYVYVAVSSNWFAAMTIESRWVSSELTTAVVAYDGRSGLYM